MISAFIRLHLLFVLWLFMLVGWQKHNKIWRRPQLATSSVLFWFHKHLF